MISAFITGSLEKIFNRYLRMDPETIERLSHLQGKVILILFPDFNLQFYLLPTHNGVQLLNTYAGSVDTTIKTSPFALMRQLKNKDHSEITIEGDVELGQQIRDLLLQMNIDWEEQLSKITGDVVAHQIGKGFRSLLSWGKQTSHNMQQNVTEYLQEEAQLLPSRKEIEDFLNAVSFLRNDVERLEAKLELLEK